MTPSDPMQHFRGKIAKYLTEADEKPTIGPEGEKFELPARRLTEEWARDLSYSLDGGLKGLIRLRTDVTDLEGRTGEGMTALEARMTDTVKDYALSTKLYAKGKVAQMNQKTDLAVLLGGVGAGAGFLACFLAIIALYLIRNPRPASTGAPPTGPATVAEQHAPRPALPE